MTAPIRIGGLFRCCIETARMHTPVLPLTEGDTLTCAVSNSGPHARMVYREGAWEWDKTYKRPAT